MDCGGCGWKDVGMVAIRGKCVSSLCMHYGVHCRLFHWFLGKCFLVEVHPYMSCFCTFWQSAFSVTCFGAFFER